MGGTHIFLPNHNEDLIIYNMYSEGLIQGQFLQSMETLYYKTHFTRSKHLLKMTSYISWTPFIFFKKISTKNILFQKFDNHFNQSSVYLIGASIYFPWAWIIITIFSSPIKQISQDIN